MGILSDDKFGREGVSTTEEFQGFGPSSVGGDSVSYAPVGNQLLTYSVITSFTEEATPGANVGASQGVATNGTWFWTSANDVNNQTVKVFNSSWVDQALDNDCNADFPTLSQVNGLYADRINNKLYVGANNFSGSPERGWILEYNFAVGTGALTYVTDHEVSPGWCEGCTFYENFFWCWFHNLNQVKRFNTSWILDKTFDLGLPPIEIGTNTHQGGFFLDDVLYLNYHGNGTDPNSIANNGRCNGFLWNRSADTLIPVASRLNPPVDCNQGMDRDGTDVYFSERTGNSINPPNNVVRASYTILADRTANGPPLIGGREFFDATATTSITITGFVPPAGTNRLALVFGCWEMNAPPMAQSVTDVTYGVGNSFTELITVFNPNATAVHNGLSVWYMLDADIPATSEDVVMNFSQSIGNDTFICVVVFNNVVQAAPNEGLISSLSNSIDVVSTGTNRTLINYLTNANDTSVPANNQIIFGEALDLEFEGMGAFLDKPAAGVQTLSWTDPNSDRPISVGFALPPFSASPAVPPDFLAADFLAADFNT